MNEEMKQSAPRYNYLTGDGLFFIPVNLSLVYR